MHSQLKKGASIRYIVIDFENKVLWFIIMLIIC